MRGPPRLPPPLPRRLIPPLRPGQDPLAFDPRAHQQHGRETSFRPTGNLLGGEWIAFNSTWINRGAFLQGEDAQGNRLPTGTMYLEFVDGAQAMYRNFPANDWLDLVSSSSKGRYVYYQIKERKVPYQLINGATRSREEVKAIIAARQPKTGYQSRRYFNVGGKRNAGGGVPSRLPSRG